MQREGRGWAHAVYASQPLRYRTVYATMRGATRAPVQYVMRCGCAGAARSVRTDAYTIRSGDSEPSQDRKLYIPGSLVDIYLRVTLKDWCACARVHAQSTGALRLMVNVWACGRQYRGLLLRAVRYNPADPNASRAIAQGEEVGSWPLLSQVSVRD